jgi:hypothetical protein
MTWWQGILIIIGCIVAGCAVGLGVGYSVLRWKHKLPDISTVKLPRLRKQNSDLIDEPTIHEQPSLYPIENILNHDSDTVYKEELPDSTSYADKLLADFMNSRNAVETQIDHNRLAYIKELENNLNIAVNPDTNKLSAFHTDVWDNNHSAFSELPSDIKTELREAYTDIVMANTIVWLSTGVGRRSKSLDNSYLNLCSKIADRLRNILPALKETD